MGSALTTKIDNLGRFITKNLEYTSKVAMLAYLSLRAGIIERSQGFRQILGVVLSQIYFTGFQALPLITVMGLATGIIVLLQSVMNLSMVGGTQMIGNLIVAMLVREVSPLLVALIVIARSGTAVATEVGNMRANREIEALESMGINPLSFIVYPRILGGVISVVCLSFYFSMISVLGGFFVTSLFHNLSLNFYVDSIMAAFQPADVWSFLAKNIFNGAVIFVVSCYQGLSVKRSPHEVPQVTTTAVMNSIVFVFIFNMIVTTLFYLEQLQKLGVI